MALSRAIIVIISYLADAFIQSDLQLIRLSMGTTPPPPECRVKGLAQGLNTALILSWLHWDLNHQPSECRSCTLDTRIQGAPGVGGQSGGR